MNKHLVKVLCVPFFCLVIITSLSLPSYAYNYPPDSVVDFSLPNYSSNLPYFWSSNYPSGFSNCVRFYTVDYSGHPYYWEFYFDGFLSCTVTYYYYVTGRYSHRVPHFYFTNNSSVSQTFHFKTYVYDATTGFVVASSSRLFAFGSINSYLDSYSLSPGSSVRLFQGFSSSVSDTMLCPYISLYCNVVPFSGSFDTSSNNVNTPSYSSFSYSINSFIPGSNNGSLSGSGIGSYDPSTGDINVDVNLEQDYSPLIDSNPGYDVPQISDQHITDFEDELSDLPSLQASDFDTAFDNVIPSDSSAIGWVYDQVEDLSIHNEKIFACILSILAMSLIMFILNKKGV